MSTMNQNLIWGSLLTIGENSFMCSLFLLFTIVPLVELMLLVRISERIGFSETLLIVVFTGIVGASLARQEGISTLKKIQSHLDKGIMPTNELLNGLMILVGAIFLVTPGVITDIFGFSLLFPPTRALLRKYLVFLFKNRMKMQMSVMTPFSSDFNSNHSRPNIIEGEIIEGRVIDKDE